MAAQLLVTISLLLFLTFPYHVNCIIPRVCASNLTRTPSICCPIPPLSLKPCGFPVRGKCRRFQVFEPSHVPKFNWIYSHDLRQAWPSRVFQYGCECFDQYGSFDCGECRFGYEGGRCQHRVKYVRQNIKTYTPKMKRRLQNVLMATRRFLSDYVVPENYGTHLSFPYKKITVQEELAAVHWFSSYGAITRNKTICSRFSKTINYNHDGTAFMMWHRYYLLLWEYRTRNIARKLYGWQNFTFPYWDWTDAKTCEVCTDDVVCKLSNIHSPGGGYRLSRKCPYNKWKVICSDVTFSSCLPCYFNKKVEYINRKFLTNYYPTTEEVKMALSFPTYYSSKYKCTGFAEYFEGPIGGCGCRYRLHNQVHMNILGPFNRSRTAANDPMFYLHHSQLDRLFQRWFTSVGPSKDDIPSKFFKPGHCRECTLIGFYPTKKVEDMFVDIRSLGVDYDNYDFGKLKAAERVKPMTSMDQFPHKTCKPHKVQLFTLSKSHYHDPK